MVKALFALSKYLTWRFIKPLVSRRCVANLTRMLQTASFNQTHALVKQYFSFLLGGDNIHNNFVKSIASSHYFIRFTASSRCVEDSPGHTLVHTLVHDKYSPACWVPNMQISTVDVIRCVKPSSHHGIWGEEAKEWEVFVTGGLVLTSCKTPLTRKALSCLSFRKTKSEENIVCDLFGYTGPTAKRRLRLCCPYISNKVSIDGF